MNKLRIVGGDKLFNLSMILSSNLLFLILPDSTSLFSIFRPIWRLNLRILVITFFLSLLSAVEVVICSIFSGELFSISSASVVLFIIGFVWYCWVVELFIFSSGVSFWLLIFALVCVEQEILVVLAIFEY